MGSCGPKKNLFNQNDIKCKVYTQLMRRRRTSWRAGIVCRRGDELDKGSEGSPESERFSAVDGSWNVRDADGVPLAAQVY